MAYESFKNKKSADNMQQRGILLPYDSLPGSVVRIVLPLFGIKPPQSWISAMKLESRMYSKSRGRTTSSFSGDSESKNKQASAAVKKWAKNILYPTYIRMRNASVESLSFLLKQGVVDDQMCRQIVENGSANDSWRILSEIP